MSDANRESEINQYLTFVLEQESYAFSIANVREVLQFDTVTKVPRTPDFMRGIINLRGSVVPVVDMRLKFGIGRVEKTVNTSVIVIEVEIDNEPTMLGALTDSVQEVIDLESEEITPPPRLGTRLHIDFIKGMGRRADRFITILDLEKVFTSDELTLAQSMSALQTQQEEVLQEEPEAVEA